MDSITLTLLGISKVRGGEGGDLGVMILPTQIKFIRIT